MMMHQLTAVCLFRKVYVLFGSQTGNAESIAKELAQRLSEESIPVECITLNAIKGAKFKDECLFLTVVCSTTGNGDCPENADGWWRSVKLRSAVSIVTLAIKFYSSIMKFIA
jgi:sulfite reductase alpha subunit-like flavoprotein